MAEEWRSVVGYEGSYEVSDRGRVRSLDRLDYIGRRRSGAMLHPFSDDGGYLCLTLRKNGKPRKVTVHVLVLEAFVGPRPPEMLGCHWNDIPYDNRLENLRWDTRSANMRDAVRNGRHVLANRTHCPQGHEYTAENTYKYARGSRACIECTRIYADRNKDRRRAASREYMRKKRAAMRAQTKQGADL